MKKSAKYLALAEAILLLSFSYLSCSDADEQETTGPDTHPAIETAAEVEEETSDPRLIPDVEIMKQNDMVFRIYGYPPNEGGHWSVHDMVTDDLDGTVLNDSIYERNRFLEETYGFSIDVTTASSMQQEIANLVSSGDNTYQVYGSNARTGVASAQMGYYRDLQSLENMDLTRSHWDHSLIDPLTVENRAFLATGDITVVPKEGVRVFYFNKDLIEDLHLESPYDLVLNGTWTLDKMFEMMQNGASDLNGDGIIDDNDRYAFQGSGDFPILFYLGANEEFIGKDENDSMILMAENERSVNVMMHVAELLDQNKDIIIRTWDWQGMLRRFDSQNALFYTDAAVHIETMRSYEVNFGILPTPKYDAAQDTYINYIDYFCNIFYAIPVCAPDPENTAYILEVISAASKQYITPAYYDVCLKSKYARDEESSRMLDIIFDTYRLELSNVYNLPISGNATELMGNGKTDFSSLFASQKRALLRQLDKISESYRSNEAFGD